MMKEKFSVLVLMSTYNGEYYLSEQVLSILRQKQVSVHLLIRDDGSSDGTIEILKNIEATNSNINILYEANVGCARSFSILLEVVTTLSESYDFYAFADQDDHWAEDKLISAIEKIKLQDQRLPILYTSNVMITNRNLVPHSLLFDVNRVNITKATSLVQCFAIGCTMVFNYESVKLYLMNQSKWVPIHDYWMYLIHVFCGVVVFDPSSKMYYRQHSRNLTGARKTYLSVLRSRIKSIGKLKERHREKMAKNLLAYYESYLSDDDKKLIATLVYYRDSIVSKLSFFFNSKIKMNTFSLNFWLRVRILFGSV